MTELLAAVKQRWAENGVAPGGPASAAIIASFEQRYGVSLPSDVRDYFATLNGFEGGMNGGWDDDLLAFWSLSEVRPLSEECPERPIPNGNSHFVFADHSFWVHAFAVHLIGGPGGAGSVSAVYDEVLMPVAPSFSAFLRSYLNRDQFVLYPDPSPEWRAKHPERAV